MTKSRSLALACLASFALAATASAQLSVTYRDADLGGTVTFVLRGNPGDLYLNMVSLTDGPTCFPPSQPVGCIDVDLQLFYLTFQVPGFFATIPSSGETQLTFGVPYDPAFDGLLLRDQMVLVAGKKLAAKSNQCRILFGLPDTWRDSFETIAADRAGVPAVTLDDGRLLLAGGAGANLDECEIFDPRDQSFAAAASLHAGRAGHTVTKLSDGRVLVTGGADVNVTTLSSAELYDPALDAWTVVGSMTSVRAAHSANLLPDGRVLVAGGSTDVSSVLNGALSALKSTEYFTPSTLSFGAGTDLARPHTAHSAVSLASGDLLVASGASWFKLFGIPIPELSNKAQVYSASGGTWSSELTMKAARVGAGAILLADGRALLAGGIGGSVSSPTLLSSSEAYDPASNTFLSAGSMSLARATMAMVVLTPTHEVLVAGGTTGTDITNPSPTDLVERFDPTTGAFRVVAPLALPRAGAAGALLDNDLAAVLGGVGAPAPAGLYRD